MRRYLKPVLLVALFAGAIWHSLPERKPVLELQLKLARREWYVGQSPWYLLTMKNVGDAPVMIFDPAWFFQSKMIENGEKEFETYFEVTGPDGKELRLPFAPWGIHGELAFWGNDCGGGRLCESYLPPTLKPGDAITATPSMERPVRRDSDTLDGYDMRAIPYAPDGWPADKVKKLKQDWKAAVDSIWLMGNPRLKTNAAAARAALLRGYRILEGYDFKHPGIYRIRAVYNTRTHRGYLPHIPDGISKEGRDRLIRMRAEARNRAASPERRKFLDSVRLEPEFHVTSDAVQIEVKEAPPSLEGPALYFKVPPKHARSSIEESGRTDPRWNGRVP